MHGPSSSRTLSGPALVAFVMVLIITNNLMTSQRQDPDLLRSNALPSSTRGSLASEVHLDDAKAFRSINISNLDASVPTQKEAGQADPEFGPALTLEPTLKSVSVGSGPEYATVNDRNGWIYVTNSNSDNVSIINGTTVYASVDVGSEPDQIVFDAMNGLEYVVNTGVASYNLSVINGTKLAGSISVGTEIGTAAFDSANGYVYVLGADGVSVISGFKLLTTISTGSAPSPIACAVDTENGFLYVADFNSDSVSVINGTALEATITVGSYPAYVTYDKANGYVYVSNNGGNTVSVINGTGLIGSVKLGDYPGYSVFDPSDDDVYVANSSSDELSVLSGTTLIGSVTVGTYPFWMTFDPGNSHLYVLDSGSKEIDIVNGSENIGSVTPGQQPECAVFDPNNGFVYIVNTLSNNVSAIIIQYPLWFSESGLPSGTSWWVNLTNGASAFSSGARGMLNETYGNYNYSIGSANKTYEASEGGISFNLTNFSVTIVFTEVWYLVAFDGSGLPFASGTVNWSITVGGMTHEAAGDTVNFSLVNGTYSFKVGFLAGWTAFPSSGTISILGANLSKVINWTVTTFSVLISRSGVPIGAMWSLTLAGGGSYSTNASSLSLREPNGSYEYYVSAINQSYSAPSGAFVVSGGPTTLNVKFGLITFDVYFYELGLSAGTYWSVTLGNESRASANNSLSFQRPNGSYRFLIDQVPGWTTANYIGIVSISGSTASEAVPWTQLTYSIEFKEQGLSPGTAWSVILNGTKSTSITTSVILVRPNGTYLFSVSEIAGYTLHPPSGAIAVAGNNTTEEIEFLPISPTHPHAQSFLGLPQIEGYELIVATAFGLVAALALLAWRVRKGGPAQKLVL